MPKAFRITHDKAMQGRSRKLAIFAQCWECLGWEIHPDTDCTSPECPLYPYRPYGKVGRPKNISARQREAMSQRGKQIGLIHKKAKQGVGR